MRKCSYQDSRKRTSLKEIEMFICERGIIKGIAKRSKAIREADLSASILSKEKSTQRELRKSTGFKQDYTVLLQEGRSRLSSAT